MKTAVSRRNPRRCFCITRIGSILCTNNCSIKTCHGGGRRPESARPLVQRDHKGSTSPRTELKPAKYHENSNWSPLVCLAFSIIYPEGTAETAVSPFQTNMLYYYNATDFELHVGGTYHGFLLHLERSLTQYTGVPPRIPAKANRFFQSI
jgi:hypothetical protein